MTPHFLFRTFTLLNFLWAMVEERDDEITIPNCSKLIRLKEKMIKIREKENWRNLIRIEMLNAKPET